MSGLVIGVILLFILFGLALVIPLILIRKWKNRPILVLIIAAFLCGLFTSALFWLTGEAVNEATDFEFSIAIAVFGFIFGLPILALVQWRSRKTHEGLTKKVIEDTF